MRNPRPHRPTRSLLSAPGGSASRSTRASRSYNEQGSGCGYGTFHVMGDSPGVAFLATVVASSPSQLRRPSEPLAPTRCACRRAVSSPRRSPGPAGPPPPGGRRKKRGNPHGGLCSAGEDVDRDTGGIPASSDALMRLDCSGQAGWPSAWCIHRTLAAAVSVSCHGGPALVSPRREMKAAATAADGAPPQGHSTARHVYYTVPSMCWVAQDSGGGGGGAIGIADGHCR